MTVWKSFVNDFHEIIFVSKAFSEAISNSRSHLQKLSLENNDEEQIVKGTFIVRDRVYMVSLTYSSATINGVIFEFTKLGTFASFYIHNAPPLMWSSSIYYKDVPHMEITANSIIMIMSILTFKKYAKVETKFKKQNFLFLDFFLFSK